jgi:hypothetical protein
VPVVLESVFAQSVLPDAVQLNLPRLYRGCEAYTDLALDSRVEVFTISGEDPGPIMKVLPTLDRETDSETLIITIDDDVVYPADMIEVFLEATRQHPGAAFGSKGFNFDAATGHILPSRGQLESCDVLQGYGACAYRRKFFDVNLLRRTLADQPTGFRYSDDVILSNHLAHNTVPRLTVELEQPLQHQPWGDDDPAALKFAGGGTHIRYLEMRDWLVNHNQWYI